MSNLFPIPVPPLAPNQFPVIVIFETLMSYDGPLTFTFHGPHGTPMLAHLITEAYDRWVGRYAAQEVSQADVEALRQCRRSIADTLGDSFWVIDINGDGEVLRSWWVGRADLPADALPKPDVMLYARASA